VEDIAVSQDLNFRFPEGS